MPETPFVMGYRKILKPEDQTRVLAEVRRLNPENPRIYVGILWLCTYIKLRPSDLLEICECHINFETGCVLVPSHKTDKMKNALPKIIALLPQDVEIIKRIPRAISPNARFFRQDTGAQGTSRDSLRKAPFLFRRERCLP